MLTVRFNDRSFAIQAKLAGLLNEACVAAADRLAEGYQVGLAVPAPPHSNEGEIPHAYFGWKPGGYGPTNPTLINNRPPEFSSAQTAPLSEYIDFAASSDPESPGAVVGFSPSHVTNRGQNYLLRHDRQSRPWVKELYRSTRPLMIFAVKSVFRRDS